MRMFHYRRFGTDAALKMQRNRPLLQTEAGILVVADTNDVAAGDRIVLDAIAVSGSLANSGIQAQALATLTEADTGTIWFRSDTGQFLQVYPSGAAFAFVEIDTPEAPAIGGGGNNGGGGGPVGEWVNVFAMNAGPGTYGAFTTDSKGGDPFIADADGDITNIGDLVNPAPAEVYKSFRAGASQTPVVYSFPGFQNANHRVRLHFMEPFFQVYGGRRFHVDINGARRKHALDIYAEAGGGKNLGYILELETFPTEDGNIDLTLVPVVDWAIIQGVEIDVFVTA